MPWYQLHSTRRFRVNSFLENTNLPQKDFLCDKSNLTAHNSVLFTECYDKSNLTAHNSVLFTECYDESNLTAHNSVLFTECYNKSNLTAHNSVLLSECFKQHQQNKFESKVSYSPSNVDIRTRIAVTNAHIFLADL